MHNKTRSAEFKALTGDGVPEGSFSAVVAVYGNVDKVGDRIADTAFDATLENWRKSGDPIPIVLAHEWKDPWSHIGYAMPDKVKSVPGVGLMVEEGILDVGDNPVAAQVHKLMKRRTLKEFSFGYAVPDGGQKKASDGAFDLNVINLIEFGPCLKGVNDRTQLLAVKSAMSGGEASMEDRLAALEVLVKTLIPDSEDEDVEVLEAKTADLPDLTSDEAEKEAETEIEPEVKPEVEPETKDDELPAEEGPIVTGEELQRQMATILAESSIALVEDGMDTKAVFGKGYDTLDEIDRMLRDAEAELG